MRPEFDKILTRLTNMRSRRMQLEIIRLEGEIEAEKKACDAYCDGVYDALRAVESLEQPEKNTDA